jgi:hypothetical protein
MRENLQCVNGFLVEKIGYREYTDYSYVNGHFAEREFLEVPEQRRGFH